MGIAHQPLLGRAASALSAAGTSVVHAGCGLGGYQGGAREGCENVSNLGRLDRSFFQYRTETWHGRCLHQ
eukprot:1168370-Prymnesium_polylepis.1